MSHPPASPAAVGAPTALLAVAVGGQVILAWTEGAGGGLGFCIERSAGRGRPFAEIGRVGPRVMAYRDDAVRPHTTYAYRVRAWRAAADSPPSNVAEVTTPGSSTGRDTADDGP